MHFGVSGLLLCDCYNIIRNLAMRCATSNIVTEQKTEQKYEWLCTFVHYPQCQMHMHQHVAPKYHIDIEVKDFCIGEHQHQD